ncbi:M16 family metallopeptidase [Microlunatus speluncae]|uniref:M16 family metallopeptidase n=1 Tax=Microlunatus speluncae TaxID=2594267 RepID=UPI0012664081|nr:pitrilysin family protein [Microlunatus speluncae]
MTSPAEQSATAHPITTSYPISETVLGNGLRVIASPDHNAPSVAVNLWYDVGSRHEQLGRTGFAHLFEHIMFQGSAHVAAGQHIGLMQAAGAMVNATTSMDRTNYFETLPTGGADLALWLEADRMGTLLDALTQENLDTQREVVKEEKRQRYDNVPYGDAMQRLIELTFPAEHPYGHTTIGSMDDLNAATLEDVRAFFGAHYLPNNAVLTIAGDLQAEDAFARAERYFGGLAPDLDPADPDDTPLPAITGLPQQETSAAVPADAIYLTWRLPTRDTAAFDAADLALSILGHGQTSRLHRALVRGAELAESAAAMTMPLIGGTSLGLCYARARSGVEPERLTEALLAELTRLRTDGPTEIEVRRAKAQFERHWLNELARIDSRADAIGEYATLHGDPTLINSRLSVITGIGRDQIAAALTEHLDPDHRATLIYRKESE